MFTIFHYREPPLKCNIIIRLIRLFYNVFCCARNEKLTVALLFADNVLRGAFCEQRSQKIREPRRKIMHSHDFCALQGMLLVTERTVTQWQID